MITMITLSVLCLLTIPAAVAFLLFSVFLSLWSQTSLQLKEAFLTYLPRRKKISRVSGVCLLLASVLLLSLALVWP